MPLFVYRLLTRLTFLRKWATPVVVVLFVFGTSWPLMAVAEPAGSALVRPANYWWYFTVTAATVGYGDMTPETALGRLVGGYVILGGIAALTTVFTNLVAALEQLRGRRTQGAITVSLAQHIVLIGYTPGRTERIVGQLLADDAASVVLCTWEEVTSHPMPERPVEFVRGDPTDGQVLRRAGVHRARTVLVDAHDDNEALAVAVAVDHVYRGSHLVVTLRDMARAPLFGYVDAAIRCVQWHAPRMITEELTSPGISDVYAELMTHGGANTYSVALPDTLGRVPVDRCRTLLNQRHQATLLAARSADGLLVNPSVRTVLPAGAVLYYIAERRLDAGKLTDGLRGAPAAEDASAALRR
ncbi:ion channel [Actinocatenispora thailandica]